MCIRMLVYVNAHTRVLEIFESCVDGVALYADREPSFDQYFYSVYDLIAINFIHTQKTQCEATSSETFIVFT